MKGFDCASSLSQATALKFKADGYGFVCRYLVPSGWKALTKTEADAISKAGLQILSVYETTANRALGGYDAGKSDGLTALTTAQKVGQPEGSTIYFAVDFDASNAQMGIIEDYLKGAKESLALKYNIGVYGSYDVIKSMKARGAVGHFWQTYAWSGGKKMDGINVYQNNNGPQGIGLTKNGITIDEDVSYGNEGFWSTNKVVATKPVTTASATTKGAEKMDKIKVDLVDSNTCKTQTIEGILIDGVTYLPIRQVGDFLGAEVGYDASTHKASLKK